jgi:hypothetical protein
MSRHQGHVGSTPRFPIADAICEGSRISRGATRTRDSNCAENGMKLAVDCIRLTIHQLVTEDIRYDLLEVLSR